MRYGPDWWEQAACAGQSLDLFYPGTNGQKKEKKAKQFCARCPVKLECLNDALAAEYPIGPRFGIFGGLTHQERKLLFGGLREVSSSALRTFCG